MFDETNTPYSDSSTTTLTEQPTSETQAEQAKPVDQSEGEDTKSSMGSDDFASALESFTTEAEETAGEDHLIHGTVLKLTPTHVFVDIGAKSEGMLPIAEVVDHDGKPKFQAGDAIDVIREKGETEEG